MRQEAIEMSGSKD
jgi:hypothetical protein